MSTSDFPVVPREAHALTLFRILPNGEGRSYSAVTFPRNPYQGCERMIRMARATGSLTPPDKDGYAVMDVLDQNGDIIADYTVPDARSFAWLKKKLGLVVETLDELIDH